MNKDRRTELDRIGKSCAQFVSSFSMAADEVRAILDEAVGRAQAVIDGIGEIGDLASDVETVRDEEQESFDNLPEGFQNSERGERANDAIEHMDNAHDLLEEVRDFMSELDLAEIFAEKLDELATMSEKIEDAQNALEEAVGA